MKSLLNLLFLFIPLLGLTQTTTEYFSDRYLTKKTSEKKANYLLINTNNDDGTTSRKVVKTSDQSIITLEHYRGQEPIGIWIITQNKKQLELDYDFPMVYAEKPFCNNDENTFVPSANMGFLDPLKNMDSLGYFAPKAIVGINNITSQMIYPAKAIDDGLMGEVQIGFKISETAEVVDFYVLKGAHPLLDKEALRCFRLLKFESPAKINGVPKAICMKQRFTFRME